MDNIYNVIKQENIKYENKLKVYVIFDAVKSKKLFKDLKTTKLNYDILFKEDKLRK